MRNLLFLTALTCAAQQPEGYNGIWYFNQPSKDQYVYKYSGGFATYPQQQSPIAIYAPAVNKTFFCYGGARPGEQRLLQMVSYFDHKTGTVPRPTLLIDKATEDAHDNPVMSIDADGYIWIFSNAHGTSRPAFIHRSKQPYDVSAFDIVVTTNFSYGHPWFVPGQGFLFLHTIYAGKCRGLRWSTSPDGRAWSESHPLARIELGHYQITAHSNARTATVFNVHPEPVGLNARTNLYYLETTDMGKTWKTVNGAAVQTPLTAKANPALVHDYQAENRLVYLKEVAFNNDGHPVILYMTSASYESGPKSDPHIWHTARWTGEKWEIRELTRSDHNYDFGALWIEKDSTWRVIAPTLPGPIPYTTGGDMVMWTSKNQGQSWQSKRLTHARERNHTYARKPVNAHPDFYAIWADGHTLRPSDSSLYFATKSGKVYRLPSKMTSVSAKPELVK
ncbi:MAG: BNR-4 repeat-containing protein [Bryobacterales bacterium]|nr:BNR-4 repeat-containing protein [Bryobacterales bacterium]